MGDIINYPPEEVKGSLDVAYKIIYLIKDKIKADDEEKENVEN